MVTVKWTGDYPTLCRGKWILIIDGIDYSHMIPEKLLHNHMNTYGIYQEWYFDENMSEQFQDYQDGLLFEDWLFKNPWVRDLPAPSLDIYLAFQNKDWRHNSCGGCV